MAGITIVPETIHCHLPLPFIGEPATVATPATEITLRGSTPDRKVLGGLIMTNQWFERSKAISLAALTLSLILAVACGSAAPADTQTAATSAPQPAAAAQPTAVPEAMAEPEEAMSEVNPGKVTWMTAAWGNERFDHALGGAPGSTYIRPSQGYLIVTNEKSELLPGLATDWGISEDGLTWTLTIRKGVKFQDGTDLTAADVLWNWQRCWSAEAQTYTTYGGCPTLAHFVDKLEQTADDQVSMTSTIPMAGFPPDLSRAGPHPYAIFPKQAKIHDEALEAAYEKNPIGAGPFKLLRRESGAVMEFERFEDYYYQPKNGLPEDRRPKFSFFDLRLVPEEATRVAAIRAGDADIGPVSIGARKQLEAGGARVVFGREGVYFRPRLFGCYQPLDHPCTDRRVRQALNYAMDKEQIQKLLGGPEVMEIKGWAATTPSTIGYSPEIDPFPFDPDKARQLLAEAGYKTPTNPQGKDFGKFVINTWVSSAMPLLPESAQLAADFWKRELGIDTEVRVGDEVGLKKARKTGELNGQMLWRDNETRLDASSVTRSGYGDPDRKDKSHDDPEIYKLVQDAVGVFDQDKLEDTWVTVYRRLRDEQYEVSVGYVNIPWAVGPSIATWQPYPLAIYPSALHTITLK